MFRTDFFTPENQWDESQYYRHLHVETNIPISDVACWNIYPQYHWMHNKMNICNAQGVINFPNEVRPHSYPVFMKPIINLGGMGINARVIESEEQYFKYSYITGHFCMPYLTGPHYSIDFAIDRGDVRWHYAMLCHKNVFGSFTMFERVHLPHEVLRVAERWIHQHFYDHIGIINLEIIDDTIIESHQRMSTQFIDLYGEGWLDAVVRLYEGKKWFFVDHEQQGYSIPIRVFDKARYRYSFDDQTIEQVRQNCSSVQLFTDLAEFEYNDVFSVRLAVINSFDLVSAKDGRDLLLENLFVAP